MEILHLISESYTNFILTKEHWAQWFSRSLVGQLTSEIFSFVGSENLSDSEITVNEIHFPDYNTHSLQGEVLLNFLNLIGILLFGDLLPTFMMSLYLCGSWLIRRFLGSVTFALSKREWCLVHDRYLLTFWWIKLTKYFLLWNSFWKFFSNSHTPFFIVLKQAT